MWRIEERRRRGEGGEGGGEGRKERRRKKRNDLLTLTKLEVMTQHATATNSQSLTAHYVH